MKLQWVLNAYCQRHGILSRDEDGGAFCPDCETPKELYQTAEEIRLKTENAELKECLRGWTYGSPDIDFDAPGNRGWLLQLDDRSKKALGNS